MDRLLPGDPGEESLPGHEVVPALLPNLQGLLCQQDAAEERMTQPTHPPSHSAAFGDGTCGRAIWQQPLSLEAFLEKD